eukprot:1195839-Prorocentrum_minimum.AAC.5
MFIIGICCCRGAAITTSPVMRTALDSLEGCLAGWPDCDCTGGVVSTRVEASARLKGAREGLCAGVAGQTGEAVFVVRGGQGACAHLKVY